MASKTYVVGGPRTHRIGDSVAFEAGVLYGQTLDVLPHHRPAVSASEHTLQSNHHLGVSGCQAVKVGVGVGWDRVGALFFFSQPQRVQVERSAPGGEGGVSRC